MIVVSYVIFEVKTEDAGKINQFIKDDLISRQSIMTRDAGSLNIDEDFLYLKIEGSDDAINHAKELAKEFNFEVVSDEKAETINKKIKEDEESAASGMGMIFD